MSTQRLAYVLKIVTPMFEKKDTKFRKVISPEQQLIITLRFLESAVISTIRLESRKSKCKIVTKPRFHYIISNLSLHTWLHKRLIKATENEVQLKSSEYMKWYSL